MIEKKVLKAGVAKRKISACAKKGGYDIDLMDYTEMEDAAAQALAECSFALDLRNLQSLTDEAAEYLTKHKKSINLESVVELTEKSGQAPCSETELHCARNDNVIHRTGTNIFGSDCQD